MKEERLAVVDLGSNSFRLVVFTWVDDSWFRLSDEIHEVVRIGEGLEETGTLAALGEKGIDPEKPPYRVREGGSRICFVRDPDGYRVELIERS